MRWRPDWPSVDIQNLATVMGVLRNCFRKAKASDSGTTPAHAHGVFHEDAPFTVMGLRSFAAAPASGLRREPP
jgi:hypothetical protein